MTNKKTLLDKFWNGTKKVAKIGVASALGYLALGPTSAYSQNKISSLTESEGKLGTEALNKVLLNAWGIPTYIVIDQEGDKSELKAYPVLTTVSSNNRLIPGLNYKLDSIKTSEGNYINSVDVNPRKGGLSIEDLLSSQGSQLIKLDAEKLKDLGYQVINTENGPYVFMPIDTANNNLSEEEKAKNRKGENLGIFTPVQKLQAFYAFDKKKMLRYILSNKDGSAIQFLKLDESAQDNSLLYQAAKAALDSTGRGSLNSLRAREDYLKANLGKPINKVAFLEYLKKNLGSDKKKSKSNFNPSVSIQVGKGILGIGDQKRVLGNSKIKLGTPIGKERSLEGGLYGEASNGAKNSGNLHVEYDPKISKVEGTPNYSVKVVGGEDDNRTTQNLWGFGLYLDLKKGLFEADLSLGVVKEKLIQRIKVLERNATFYDNDGNIYLQTELPAESESRDYFDSEFGAIKISTALNFKLGEMFNKNFLKGLYVGVEADLVNSNLELPYKNSKTPKLSKKYSNLKAYLGYKFGGAKNSQRTTKK